MAEASKATVQSVNVGALIRVKGYLGEHVGEVFGQGVVTMISPRKDKLKAALALKQLNKQGDVITGEYAIPVDLISENEVELEFISTFE